MVTPARLARVLLLLAITLLLSGGLAASTATAALERDDALIASVYNDTTEMNSPDGVRITFDAGISAGRAFSLNSGPVAADSQFLPILPQDRFTDISSDKLEEIRYIAANIALLPNQQENLDRAAGQVAIWQLAGDNAGATRITDPAIQERAQFILAWADVRVTADGAPPTSIPTSISLSSDDRSTKDVELEARLLDSQGYGLLAQRVIFETVREPAWETYTNQDGVSKRVVAATAEPRSFKASWSGTLPPGTLFRSQGGERLLVLEEGLALRLRSPAVRVASEWQHPFALWSGSPSLVLRGAVVGAVVIAGLLVAVFVAALLARSGSAQRTVFALLRSTNVARAWLGILAIAVVTSTVLATTVLTDARKSSAVEPRDLTDIPSMAAMSPLTVRSVEASSWFEFEKGDGLFTADKVMDGNLSTAWVSQARLGPGQYLSVHFEQPVWVAQVEIFNGLLDAGFYESNGRAEWLQLTGDDGWVVDLPKAEIIAKNEYEQALLGEKLLLPTPVLTSHLTIRVMAIREPDFNSAAISEIKFWGLQAQ